MRDLSSVFWMQAKAGLFVLMGVGAAALVIAENPSIRVAVLLAVAVWAFCRAYYFVFYVIEHYVDPQFRFSGLGSFARYWFARRAGRSPHESPP